MEIKLSEDGWSLYAITEHDVFVFSKGSDGKFKSRHTIINMTERLSSTGPTSLKLKQVWPKNDGSYRVTYETSEGEKQSRWMTSVPMSLF